MAGEYGYVIGVDAHTRTQTYAVVDTATGASTATGTFPASDTGVGQAITWMRRHTVEKVLAAVEGTPSYGEPLAPALQTAGIAVVEVKPPSRASRAGTGKSDAIHALEAARRVLGLPVEKQAAPRADGLHGSEGEGRRRRGGRRRACGDQ
ncbi:IS110 family transposase [Arthrobacter mobilis]|uniref:IS110 family transposase n=1 Tax=Arthrobacter mobilis TaxID=2724944 RepID=UPI0028AF2792|nr:transposase [Arthrobacter mobilis]